MFFDDIIEALEGPGDVPWNPIFIEDDDMEVDVLLLEPQAGVEVILFLM